MINVRYANFGKKKSFWTHLLEVGADGEDLVYKILNGEDVVLAKGLLDDLVVGKGDTLLVNLSVSTLVNQLADGLQVRLAAEAVRTEPRNNSQGKRTHM